MTAPEPEVIAHMRVRYEYLSSQTVLNASQARELTEKGAVLDAWGALARSLATAEAERDESNKKLWAITDINQFPTSAQLQECVARLKPRDRDIVDSAFAEGATLLAIAKYEWDKADRKAGSLTAERDAAQAALGRVTLSLQQRVTQTRLHSESVNGNCTTACLASVFGGAIEVYDERVPFTPGWWQRVETIFREHGFLVLQLSPADGHPAGVCFVAGISPRGVRQLCVMQDGVIVQDPHPSRAGLTEITDYWTVIPWTFSDAVAPDPAQFATSDHEDWEKMRDD